MGDRWCWEFRQRREAFEWERELISQQTILFESVQVHRTEFDAWIWVDIPVSRGTT